MGQRHFVAGFDELVVAGFDELAPDLRRRPNVGRHFRGGNGQVGVPGMLASRWLLC
jgi:hypothetical protein